MEWEGVVVADVADLHRQAWVRLATDEGKPVPLHFTLKRADGMKNDQVQLCPASRLDAVSLG